MTKLDLSLKFFLMAYLFLLANIYLENTACFYKFCETHTSSAEKYFLFLSKAHLNALF